MFRLAISNFRLHTIRVILTITAIALSVSLVVAVTSGYSSIQGAAQKGLSAFLGTTDAQIVRRHERGGSFDSRILDDLRNDPDVAEAHGRLELASTLMRADGTVEPALIDVMGVDRPADRNVEAMRMHEGRWFDSSVGNEAVVDQVAFSKLGTKVGDEFVLPAMDRRLRLKIVGVVHKPGLLAAIRQTIYVPLTTLQQFMLPDNPNQITRAQIDLKPGADEAAFAQRWEQKLGDYGGDLRLRISTQSRKEMDQNLQGLQAMSYMGGGVAMAAATFIIFSALSMGVAERQRTLAMLRAIGALRSQLGKLVLIEGMALALAGVIVGIPLGVLWIHILVRLYSEWFTAGAIVNMSGVMYGSLGSMLTALAATLLPAWGAMRSSPLEAMTQISAPSRASAGVVSFFVGLLLLAVDPIIAFGPWSREFRFYGHFVLGIASIMIGAFLLSPLLVRGLNAALGPTIAAMFGLRYTLLKQQLAGGIWRSAGAAAALMVGLAILIVTQAMGTSFIKGWQLPDRFPDMFIYAPLGLTPADEAKLAAMPEFKTGEFLPIAVASPEFGTGIFGLAGAAMMPTATMFFGVDPDVAFNIMELDFRDGTPEQAKEMLKRGGHIIVSQEFKQLKGLGVGDKLPLKTIKGIVDFTIAGVVWSPGIDVIKSMQDMGTQFDQRTAASIFGSMEDARTYFGVQRVHLFAVNLQTGVERDALMASVKQSLMGRGLDAGDVRHIKHAIQELLRFLLNLVSLIAYAAMGIAWFGVTNTIMASIRTRRWHMGILRSIGVTRGQLLRLVLAEAVLLSIVGILIGLLAGFVLAVDAHHLWGVIIGYRPPLLIPWPAVVIGMISVLVVALGASLWPAIHVARTEPLSLLQAGRSAA